LNLNVDLAVARNIARDAKAYSLDLAIANLRYAPALEHGYYRVDALRQADWNCQELIDDDLNGSVPLPSEPLAPPFLRPPVEHPPSFVHAELVAALLRDRGGKALASYFRDTDSADLLSPHLGKPVQEGTVNSRGGERVTAEGQYSRGLSLLRGRRFDQAVACFDQVLRMDPNHAPARVQRAAAYIGQKKYGQAVADCDEAIRLDPRNAVAWNHRGYANYNLGQLKKALADLTEAVKLDPKYASAFYNRSLVYAKIGDLNLALADRVASDRLNQHKQEER
jgi:tetratricopeptide (TPR) repeat protein